MNRIVHTLAVAIGLALASLSVGAQQPRAFPEKTRLGTLEIVVFPQAKLDEKPVMLAPGARIFSDSNMLSTPASVRGPVQVLYRLDPMGQIIEAWILSAEELRRAQEAQRKEAGTTR